MGRLGRLSIELYYQAHQRNHPDVLVRIRECPSWLFDPSLGSMTYERSREVYRPFREDHAQFAELCERHLAAYRESLEALKLPLPDTFLGRKTHDPFPVQDDF